MYDNIILLLVGGVISLVLGGLAHYIKGLNAKIDEHDKTLLVLQTTVTLKLERLESDLFKATDTLKDAVSQLNAVWRTIPGGNERPSDKRRADNG